jgi:hypothetical protein
MSDSEDEDWEYEYEGSGEVDWGDPAAAAADPLLDGRDLQAEMAQAELDQAQAQAEGRDARLQAHAAQARARAQARAERQSEFIRSMSKLVVVGAGHPQPWTCSYTNDNERGQRRADDIGLPPPPALGLLDDINLLGWPPLPGLAEGAMGGGGAGRSAAVARPGGLGLLGGGIAGLAGGAMGGGGAPGWLAGDRRVMQVAVGADFTLLLDDEARLFAVGSTECSNLGRGQQRAHNPDTASHALWPASAKSASRRSQRAPLTVLLSRRVDSCWRGEITGTGSAARVQLVVTCTSPYGALSATCAWCSPRVVAPGGRALSMPLAEVRPSLGGDLGGRRAAAARALAPPSTAAAATFSA